MSIRPNERISFTLSHLERGELSSGRRRTIAEDDESRSAAAVVGAMEDDDRRTRVDAALPVVGAREVAALLLRCLLVLTGAPQLLPRGALLGFVL